MNSDTPVSTARIAGHPIFRILASFPIACFCSALLTDLAYAQTTNIMWADFSDWLLAVGMFMGVLAAIAGIVAFIADRRRWGVQPNWVMVIGSVLVLILGFLNNLVHTRDAWTSVVPTGLMLSAATVIVMLITAWLGYTTVYRPGASVRYSGARP